MKKVSLNLLALAGLALGLVAFDTLDGGIRGRITPAEGVKEVMAIMDKDTLRAQVSNGMFIFSPAKKGTYTLWIKANSPYRDTTVANVAVVDSATTDIGEIKLQQ